jgi:hypothetical protein
VEDSGRLAIILKINVAPIGTGLIHPVENLGALENIAQGNGSLTKGQFLTILMPEGRALGEYPMNSPTSSQYRA